MRRGDVYYVKSGSANNSGYTVWTGRPAVILSNDAINAENRTVEVVFLTSAPKRECDVHVQFFCKDRMATALCEQVSTLDAIQLGEYVTHLSEVILEKISEAVMKSLGLGVRSSNNADTEYWKTQATHWKNLCKQQAVLISEALNDR